MFFPATFSGGAYMNNLAEMAGGMGVHNEDIQLASYATSIGMALFAPFMAGFMTIRRVKHLFMRGFLVLQVLNGVIATTDNVVLTIAACLVIGFVRVMLMMNITFTLVKYGMGIVHQRASPVFSQRCGTPVAVLLPRLADAPDTAAGRRFPS